MLAEMKRTIILIRTRSTPCYVTRPSGAVSVRSDISRETRQSYLASGTVRQIAAVAAGRSGVRNICRRHRGNPGLRGRRIAAKHRWRQSALCLCRRPQRVPEPTAHHAGPIIVPTLVITEVGTWQRAHSRANRFMPPAGWIV